MALVSSLSFTIYPGTAGTGTDNRSFSFTVPYLDSSHIKATQNGTPRTITVTGTSGSSTVTFDPSVTIEGDNEIKIYRETPGRLAAPNNVMLVDFEDGSVLREADLDKACKQLLYMTQEAADEGVNSLSQIVIDASADTTGFDAGGEKITNIANGSTGTQEASSVAQNESTFIPITDKTPKTTAGESGDVVQLADTTKIHSTHLNVVTDVDSGPGTSGQIVLLGTDGLINNGFIDSGPAAGEVMTVQSGGKILAIKGDPLLDVIPENIKFYQTTAAQSQAIDTEIEPFWETLIAGFSIEITPKLGTNAYLYKIDVSWVGGISESSSGSGSDYTENAQIGMYLTRTPSGGSSVDLGATGYSSRCNIISPLSIAFSGTNDTNTATHAASCNFTYIVEPHTDLGTDVQTFKLGIRTPHEGCTVYTNRSVTDTDDKFSVRGVSTMTVEEIRKDAS